MANKEVGSVTMIIADDHALVKDGLEARLKLQPNYRVVATASNGDEAIAACREWAPDVLLTDINMPGATGIDVLEALSQTTTKVIMLSMHDNSEYIVKAMQLGAKGYVLKDVPSQELIVAIDSVVKGGSYYCSAVSQRLFDSMNQMNQHTEQVEQSGLTKREHDVLCLIAKGECNKTVAKQLNISVRTVETHRLRVKKKLGVTSTAGLVRYALEHKLIDVDTDESTGR